MTGNVKELRVLHVSFSNDRHLDNSARMKLESIYVKFYVKRRIHLSYIHTRRPTNPRSFPTNFYGLVGYDRVKNYPL